MPGVRKNSGCREMGKISMNQKLLYDAKFSGPRGDLNPMGLKLPGFISVRLFPIRLDKWTIKNPDIDGVLCGRRHFVSADQAMDYCGEIFTTQETKWEIKNMDGTPLVVPEEPTPK